MRPLRVVLDDILAPAPSAVSRYSSSLTRALIGYAPPMCRVEGLVAASTEPEYAVLAEKLPGLDGLHKSALARRDLIAAWQYGFTLAHGGGMLHSPSLLAPLWRRDRERGHQTVVTVHDLLAWTHPEAMPPRTVTWHKTMLKRAHKYADAVVAPTYSVAQQLSEIFDFGDRVHIVAAAPSPVSSRLVSSSHDLSDLPQQYLLATAHLDGLDRLIAALAFDETLELPLLVLGTDEDGAIADVAQAAGLRRGRVRMLGDLPSAQVARVIEHAVAFVVPGVAVGFGLHLLEAFRLGTPVIHSDVPAITDITVDAGMAVPVDDPGEFPKRLASAIGEVAGDSALATRLATTGRDRAGFFSWEITADKIWRLHADL